QATPGEFYPAAVMEEQIVVTSSCRHKSVAAFVRSDPRVFLVIPTLEVDRPPVGIMDLSLWSFIRRGQIPFRRRAHEPQAPLVAVRPLAAGKGPWLPLRVFRMRVHFNGYAPTLPATEMSV